jgi:hypothetical protein
MKSRRLLLLVSFALSSAALVLWITRTRTARWDPHCPQCGYRAWIKHTPILNLFVMKRESSIGSSCVYTLRALDGAKQQWALENGQPTNAIPAWRDIAPYFLTPPRTGTGRPGTIPAKPGAVWPEEWLTLSPVETTGYIETNGPLAFCRSGGAYQIGSVGEPPTCPLQRRSCGHTNPLHTL